MSKIYICENCEQEHDGSYGSGRFCSKHCCQAYNAKRVKHHSTAKQLKTRKGFGGQPRKIPWKCLDCDQTFLTRAKLYKHHDETGHRTEIQTGKGHGWSKGLTAKTCPAIGKAIQVRRQNVISGKTKLSGRRHTPDSKKKLRLAAVKYLQSMTKGGGPRYNKSSIPVLEKIALEHGWHIQHAENGGEFHTGIGYFLDAYDAEKNIALEYDEPKHYVDAEHNILCQKDLDRQREIIEHLHCEFWRFNSVTQLLWKVEI